MGRGREQPDRRPSDWSRVQGSRGQGRRGAGVSESRIMHGLEATRSLELSLREGEKS